MADDLQDGGRQALNARVLCRVDDLAEGSARGFRFGSGVAVRAVFVVKKGGAIYAYDDACPHMGTPLAFLPDRYFDRDGRDLLCSTHGARFRVEDGFCLSGPCAGRRLARAAIRIESDVIVLAGEEPRLSDPPA
ncbi:MAG TPA: Rieske (2Fe-2S) protein [Stellaceae bacterium]|nr:Rieske (2Fe-2S) protein [Stellaceae bacterium]